MCNVGSSPGRPGEGSRRQQRSGRFPAVALGEDAGNRHRGILGTLQPCGDTPSFYCVLFVFRALISKHVYSVTVEEVQSFCRNRIGDMDTKLTVRRKVTEGFKQM